MELIVAIIGTLLVIGWLSFVVIAYYLAVKDDLNKNKQ